jgi:hypothetical protein
LPQTGKLPPPPGVARRFFSLHQSLQDFHQPLHGLIRRLKDFLQLLKPPSAPANGAMSSAFRSRGDISDVNQ